MGARHPCLAWSNLDGSLVQRVAPPIPQPSEPKPPAVINKLRQYKEGQNSLSLLMELCQGYQWPQPEFEFVEHEQGFLCECRLKVDDEVILGSSIAPRKKTAKHRAARQVVEQLQLALTHDDPLIAVCSINVFISVNPLLGKAYSFG